MPSEMSRDEWAILRELFYEHRHPKYPQDWLPACRISGPMHRAQALALRHLLKRGLVTFKLGGYANRNRRKLWRLSEEGFKVATADSEEFEETQRARKRRPPSRSSPGKSGDK